MNQCDGCQRKLPIHLGMRIAEQEMFMYTASRYTLNLEPITRDTWVDERARKKVEAPFTFGGWK